jgi:hypothetical protein
MQTDDPSQQEGDTLHVGSIADSQGSAIGRQSSAASNNVTVNLPPAAASNDPSLGDMIRGTWLQGLTTQADLAELSRDVKELPQKHDVVQLKADLRRLQEENRKAERQNLARLRAEEEERRKRQHETDQHRALLTHRMSRIERWVKVWTIIVICLCALDVWLILDLAKRIGWLSYM